MRFPPWHLSIWGVLALVGFGLGFATPKAWRMAWVSHSAGARASQAQTPSPEQARASALMQKFASEVTPILENRCYDCHGDGAKKGGLAIDRFDDLNSMHAARKTWQSVRTHIAFNLMPPADKEPVTHEEKETLLNWIDEAIFPVDPNHPEPGRVTIRRLNRSEFQNTVRDLLGVQVDVSSLPPDDSGYGFDTIGDVLTLAPAHIERYQELVYDALEQVEKQSDKSAYGPHKLTLWTDLSPNATVDEGLQRVVMPFLQLAFRRPARDDEHQRFRDFVHRAVTAGEPVSAACKLAMEAVMLSPDFLFRGLGGLRSTAPAGSIESLSEFELAERMSYFIWSSMPDARLFALARDGQLRRKISSEVERLLNDPKASALVDRFFLQWLQVQDISSVQPDGKQFRTFHSGLRRSLLEETRLFLEHLLKENRPAVEMLTADYTFANETLARHYGLKGISGREMRKVSLAETGRQGILTQGAVLTITSQPTRTSPVKRGQWVLETILDEPAPPPPPNIPSLESLSTLPADAPLRARMEAHQANPACASCHKLMDGIGYAFEHFDAIGRWRENDNGKPIDSRGTMADGAAFDSPRNLVRILVEKKSAEFHRALASKLLTFALGRGLDYLDAPAVDKIVASAEAQQSTLRAFILATVQAVPFQMRRLPKNSPASHPTP